MISTMIKINPTRRISEREQEGAYKLWNQEYPKNLKHSCMEDFEIYLSELADPLHFFLLDDEQVLGWAFKFKRDGDVWFAIILDGKIHGRGYGSALLDELKVEEKLLNGWVVEHNNYLRGNGKPYQSPIGFYLKNGFVVVPENRLDTPNLSAIQIQWISVD